MIAQFPGPVGTPGTTAIFKDSTIFVNWASNCVVTRGFMDIAQPTLGLTSFGADTNGTKKAGVNGVVSLGDGGYAILTFPKPIMNGPGPDFAVFENAFNDTFLELAFVEVSSDGINYFRFPSVSNTQTLTQIGPFSNSGDATKLHNLAGKYRVNYGTPFDLQDMLNIPGLNVNHITHVKVIDVVGCIQAPYATYDSQNKPINDPYPTNFNTGGFDLDAVGVIHQNNNVGLTENEWVSSLIAYPQPASDFVYVSLPSGLVPEQIILYDMSGKKVAIEKQPVIETRHLTSGIYWLEIQTNETFLRKKIFISK
ncbi:MAG: T9SS type A sorting domain-containing protein [Bacteroidia bacterium]|nr:T9SS type A sorting domain-containing protein [Bacteroidia bacterium]